MVIAVQEDTAINNHGNCLFNDWKWQQKPFAWTNELAESVFDLNVEPRLSEKSVDDVLKLVHIQIDGLIGHHWSNGRHQKRWIVRCRTNPGFKIARRESNFEQLSIKPRDVRKC